MNTNTNNHVSSQTTTLFSDYVNDYEVDLSAWSRALYAALAGVGLAGNLLTLAVFSRARFAFTIFATYFRGALVADSLVLASVVVELCLLNTSSSSSMLFVCKHACAAWSTWQSVAAACHRRLDAHSPNTAASAAAVVFSLWRGKLFQASVCACLLVVAAGAYATPILVHSLLLSHLNTTTTDNTTTSSCALTTSGADWLALADITVGTTLVPIVLVLALVWRPSWSWCAARTKITKTTSSRNGSYTRVLLVGSVALGVALKGPVACVLIVGKAVGDTGSIVVARPLVVLIVELLWHAQFATAFGVNYALNRVFRCEVRSIFRL